MVVHAEVLQVDGILLGYDAVGRLACTPLPERLLFPQLSVKN